MESVVKYGGVLSSPIGVRGGAPAGNAFWRILKATERSFCTYMLMLRVGQTEFRVTFGGKSEVWGIVPLLPQRRSAPVLA